ncbi:M20 family metallopeptidase [Nocardia sp. XZ_19_385]|uniref:M20 metallopeptidase family protein n=1 Tax=Nocardia sp. XZ_19_385 TaxID=2769488 RepID=UPI00188FC096|nr:M20 family metallopeptidase [Nocardia sp. XZ_19_385]
MNLLEDARDMRDTLVALRHDLHREPETGLHVPRTQEKVLEGLQGLPLEISTGSSTTSVTAVLRGGAKAGQSPTILLRADMDALPVAEHTGLEFASRNGSMHACGHDMHTAALVGAARLLAHHRDHLAGDVVFMFQPGEEGWNGARVMLEEGVLEASGRRADSAYAMHVMSNRVPSGLFVSRKGTIMSASHHLDVTVIGQGGHGSAPDTARDPIVATAEMIISLQTAVTREFDIFDPVVVTVGVIRGGVARNVIPDTAGFSATVRCFTPAAAARLEAVIPRVLKGVALARGVEVDIDFHNEYPPTINNAAEVEFGSQVIRELLGEERYFEPDRPSNGSEDFSQVLEEVPGAFFGLGACPPDLDADAVPQNHSPRAMFSDHVLPEAAAVYAALAIERARVTL